MPCISLAITQEDLVKLLNAILAEGDLLPGGEHEAHQLAIANHLLLIAPGKRLNLEIGEQLFHLTVSVLAPLDAGGGANALNRGHAPEG